MNTPHNPTGKVFSRTELDLIAGLCQRYDTLCITDESYEHLQFPGPGGTYYVLCGTGAFDGARDDVAFVRRLVTEIGVAAVPGSSFYGGHFRTDPHAVLGERDSGAGRR